LNLLADSIKNSTLILFNKTVIPGIVIPGIVIPGIVIPGIPTGIFFKSSVVILMDISIPMFIE